MILSFISPNMIALLQNRVFWRRKLELNESLFVNLGQQLTQELTLQSENVRTCFWLEQIEREWRRAWLTLEPDNHVSGHARYVAYIAIRVEQLDRHDAAIVTAGGVGLVRIPLANWLSIFVYRRFRLLCSLLALIIIVI